ncbi:MAG: DUF262 domain-containing protein [Nitrospirota bacterium]
MSAQRMEAPITIREAILAVQKRDYLLPAIQREFVWDAEKTESLFDSLMRGYPVGSFLFWKVAPESSQRYKFYEFMQDFHALNKKRLVPFEIAETRQLTVVLDGQQRLTSLAIGLLGYRADREKGKWTNNPAAYPKRRLYLNLAQPYKSDEEIDREYDFRFLTEEAASVRDEHHLWLLVRTVMDFVGPQGVDNGKLVKYVVAESLNDFGAGALSRLCDIIIKDPVIHYFQETEQKLDRVLNIFVRLNSGGIPLSYSDLLLSIATAQWKSDAREAIYGLVDELNENGDGFEFNKDFVLKSALVLTDRPNIKFNVENFDRENTKAIEDNWDESVRKPLLQATELVASYGYHGKTLTSSNVLIPIAYYLRQIRSPSNFAVHKNYAEDRRLIRKWLVVSLLKSVFSSKTDTLLGAIRTTLQNKNVQGFPFGALDKTLASHGVPLRFSDEELNTLLDVEYGTRNAFSVLAAVYPALNTQFKFHLDHIYPKSGFDRRKLKKTAFSDDDIEFYMSSFNQIPNLQMLEGVANQSKLDTPFEDWIKPLQADAVSWTNYRSQHTIPALTSYGLKNFKEFHSTRRKLLFEKLKNELPAT